MRITLPLVTVLAVAVVAPAQTVKIETTTVELKVDSKGTRAIGKEVQSRNLTLIGQLGRILAWTETGTPATRHP